jgi:trehalose 6-phosphate synthase
LIDVARELRRLGVKNRTGFFLHIPFPTPDVFVRMPWRSQLLRSMLDYDVIGFQTLRDQRHFMRCLKLFFDVSVVGRGRVRDVQVQIADHPGPSSQASRELRIGSFPISIDYASFAAMARSRPAELITKMLIGASAGCRTILSVDRLDYTKGLPEKLEGFRAALRRHPDLLRKVVLCMHVVPSREHIPEYERLRVHIERLVGEINGEFSWPDWIPIHYFYHGLPAEELVAHYRAADVALVTSLRDGMNLIAKEFCACQVEDDGVLILSEFAGAAAELQGGALLVNPHDVEGVADTIYEAITMDASERSRRIRTLKQKVSKFDVFQWVNGYVQALSGQDLEGFATIDDYSPNMASSF